MTDIKLGQIIENDQVVRRDAIHIAVAPVIAGEELKPGEHIGFKKNNDAEIVGKSAVTIGVVDPFLRAPVLPGQRFLMFLYQNTITSLRHEWSHPAFTSREVFGKLQGNPSKEWLQNFAKTAEISYDELINAGHAYIDHSRFLCEGGKWEGFSTPDEFWDHFEEVTGRPVPDRKRGSFFTCSC